MHEIVSIVAQYFIVFSLLGTLAVFLKQDLTSKKAYVAKLVVGGIFALIFAEIARKIYYDPRPFVVGHFTPYFSHGTDNGFVSDHTLFASFLAFSAWVYSRKASLALLALAILIGAARVIAGVHHWADIISAIAISLLAAYLAHLLANLLIAKFHSKK